MRMRPGQAEPLGASDAGAGVNFAVSAPAASTAQLCLFDEAGEPLGEVPMHKQEGVWTALVKDLPKKGVQYAYRVDGPGGWETGYR